MNVRIVLVLLAVAGVCLSGCAGTLQQRIDESESWQASVAANVKTFESIAQVGLAAQSIEDQIRLAPLLQDATVALDAALAVWADINAGAEAAGKLDIGPCIAAVLDAYNRVQAVIAQFKHSDRLQATAADVRVKLERSLRVRQ